MLYTKIVTELSEVPRKASKPMVVSNKGIVAVVREEHSLNAAVPIVVTESGIVTAVREEHAEKVPAAMDVRNAGI